MPLSPVQSSRLGLGTKVLVAVSGSGLIASATWHVLALLGRELPKPVWTTLFVGIFVIWFPAVISALPLNDRISESPKDAWKILLEGAPTWMALVALYIGVYAFVNFVLATGHLTGRVSSSDESFQRVGSAFAMVFYAAGMGILYSAGARDNLVRCPEGHVIYGGQESCPVCGQRPHSESPARHGA